MSGYERRNKKVFRRCLKTESDGAEVTLVFRRYKVTNGRAITVASVCRRRRRLWRYVLWLNGAS